MLRSRVHIQIQIQMLIHLLESFHLITYSEKGLIRQCLRRIMRMCRISFTEMKMLRSIPLSTEPQRTIVGSSMLAILSTYRTCAILPTGKILQKATCFIWTWTKWEKPCLVEEVAPILMLCLVVTPTSSLKAAFKAQRSEFTIIVVTVLAIIGSHRRHRKWGNQGVLESMYFFFLCFIILFPFRCCPLHV